MISVEPGDPGSEFLEGALAKLRFLRWSGKVRILRWPADCKDPSALHIRDPQRFLEEFEKLVKASELLDLSNNKPTTMIDASAYLPDVTTAAWGTIAKANNAGIPRLFRYVDTLVRVERSDKDVPKLLTLTEPLMRAENPSGPWMDKESQAGHAD